MFSKTRVAVLRGGPSSEYEVSLKTGATVLGNLPDSCHGLDIFIDRKGDWHLQGRREDPHTILGKVDVVFNALHGEYGEDGKLQQLLEMHHVPFAGSRRFPSMLAMHKGLAKQSVSKEGIRTPYFKIVRREEAPDLYVLASTLYRSFPQPSVVKPVAKGSSLGVSVARMPEDIHYALELAFQNSDAVIIEEYVEGAEAVCAVLEGYRGEELYTFLPVQVVLPSGSSFLDYHGKHSGGASYLAPGKFSPETKAQLQEAAKAVHNLLGLRHYSSSDFIVHPKRGIYFLETDSLPTLTPASPLGAALAAVGGSIGDFLDHLIKLALGR